jgi:hypothetical protein
MHFRHFKDGLDLQTSPFLNFISIVSQGWYIYVYPENTVEIHMGYIMIVTNILRHARNICLS